MGWTFYNSSGQRLQSFGFAAATQAEMEAASSTTAYVTPGLTQNHPGVAKVWVKWEQAGTQTMSAEYGVDTIADGGASGKTDFTFDTNFSGAATYTVVGGAAATAIFGFEDGSQAADAVTMYVFNVDGNGSDSAHVSAALFGDQ